MTWTTDHEIGRLIRSAADSLPVPPADPARLADDSGRRRRRRSLAGTAATAALLVAAVTSAVVLEGRRPLPITRVTTTAPASAVFPTVRPGHACPATPGQPVSNAYFVGFELGQGPVRMLIANAGDLRRGVVYIAPSDKGNPLGPAAYYAFQNFWYSLPSYRGTWTVTAQRLDGPGRVLFGDAHPTAVAQPVPAGAAQEFGPGYRSGIGSTWINAPGCYGFAVSGQGLGEIIVVDVVLR